jgi:hypothetical protein
VGHLRSRQRGRQAARQTDRVGPQARDHVVGVPGQIITADRNSNVFRPIGSSLNLIGALPSWILEP